MASSELSPVHIEGLPSPDPTPGGFYNESEKDESNFYVDPDELGGEVEGEPDDFIPVDELAKQSGYTTRQLYRLAEEGRVRSEKRLVPIIQEREKLFISASSVEKYLLSNKLDGRSKGSKMEIG